MNRLACVACFLAFVAGCGGETGFGADASVSDAEPDTRPDTAVADSGGPVDSSGPSCTDGLLNRDESDVDCGGSCPQCRDGQACRTPSECIGGQCLDNACVDPSCEDGAQNGTESDLDCGGDCSLCVAGDGCNSGRDCVSRFCGDDGLCLASACDDGVRNGDETDVDCGGACSPCAECEGCVADGDCARGRCVSGRCALSEEIYIDWSTDCSTDGSRQVTADLPMGRYRVTAVNSGGTVWSTWSPPTRGWYYRIECTNLSVPTVATPSGIYYANATTAFSALMSTSEDVDFAGGTLVCAKRDSACTDNSGGVRFRVERLCL
ncbi:MAG: hypothetical protein DRJ42_06295 [Deltaproteobacteria bacterium]|nr:MAG: hypothetical protein DRJ42_06295 [Deltaproteobacteria bacterium]